MTYDRDEAPESAPCAYCGDSSEGYEDGKDRPMCRKCWTEHNPEDAAEDAEENAT